MRPLVAALLMMGVLACSRRDDAGKGGASTTEGAVVDMYRIGRSVAPDGSATAETDLYTVGETVYMSFVLKNAPSGAKIRLVFSSMPDNRKVAELESSRPQKGLFSFEMKDTARWALGPYRAEYFLVDGGKEMSLGYHDFKLVASRTDA